MSVHTSNGISGLLTTKGWVMVAILAFFAPLVSSNYFFHDELWMLGWSINSSWTGNDLACGQSNLFWGSYFMDGRFLSAFIADCVVKPTMNWGYAHGDLYTAQAMMIGARVLSLFFFSIFIWQMMKLLEKTANSPPAAAAATLAVALLPGMAFMVLWGHAIVFNISFLLTAIFILAFRKSLIGESHAAPFMTKLLLITVLVSFLGYGLYTVTGLYLAIPVALYIGLVSNDFQWNSREEKAVRTVLLGLVVATLLFIVMQKISGAIFAEHVSANSKPSVSTLGGGQLLQSARALLNTFNPFDTIWQMSYLWFLPKGHLTPEGTNTWKLLSAMLLHICIFGSIILMVRKNRQSSFWRITVNPRFFYLTSFFWLALSFVVMANAIQPRVTMVAQSIYIAMAIALIRHFIKPHKTSGAKDCLIKASAASAFAIWIFMHWYVLNNMLLISAREEGMLSTMIYALGKGEVSSVTVRRPNVMVEPDSYGPTLLMPGHYPGAFAEYYLAPEGGMKQNHIQYTTNGASWFRFSNTNAENKPTQELYFDGREMSPRPSKWAQSKLNAAEKAAILTSGHPQITVSSSAVSNYDPNNLLSGDIWHSDSQPTYPQWVGIKYTKALIGTAVLLWHQPSHAERSPKSVIVRGYRNGIEVGHFSSAALSCVPGQTPSRIDTSTLGSVDTVRLEIQSNCGDPQYLTIGKLEID